MLEEDFLVNYGFLPRAHSELMHPRTARHAWTPRRHLQADAVLAFVRERGAVHPREVDAQFAHGKVTNWFGGSSNATTRLLDEMHYRGLLRVTRREGGTRVYAAREGSSESPDDDATIAQRLDAMVDIVVNKYAPLPASSLGRLLSLLCVGVPQWRTRRAATLIRAKQRLAYAKAGNEEWYWPETESPTSRRWCPDAAVRLLTPFDPIVFDRRRFEIFWGWPYRFEAYVPPPKRKLGYYALPLLTHDRVVGWGNVAVKNGRLSCSFGYVSGSAPGGAEFRKGLAAELNRMRLFLGLTCL